MRALCVAAAAAVMTGCSSPNTWEEAFRPATSESATSLPDGAPVTVRPVEMDQVRQASAAAREYVDSRSVALTDLNAEDDRALRRSHFEAFGYHDDPAHYEYLGHAALTQEKPVNKDDVWIIQAARWRGANLVFVASEFAGPDTKLSDTSVWAYSTGSVQWRNVPAEYRSDPAHRKTPAWAPLPMEAERYSNLAVFYRRVEQ